jgi:DinB superfamily
MTTLIIGETWGDNVESVRSFLLREAEQPLGALRSKLDAVRQEFCAALDGVSDAQAQFTPASGEGEAAWGIAEVVRHIASIEPIMAERLRLLGTGRSADGITRTYPGYMLGVDTRRIADLRTLLDRTYADLVGAIAAIDGSEHLDTLAAHRRFGDLNCRGWVALHTLHLQDHARQIGRIKHLEGYPAA